MCMAHVLVHVCGAVLGACGSLWSVCKCDVTVMRVGLGLGALKVSDFS